VRDDPHVIGAGLLPTPFTAEDIRRGCPAGRRILVRVEKEGARPEFWTSYFLRCDDEGADIESGEATADGEPLGKPVVARSSWSELQRHAAFPADVSRVESRVLDSPFGPLECLVYSVGRGDTTSRFWFARRYPGMPVRYEDVDGDRVVASTVMVDTGMPTVD
jgi:hypothetical protein